MRMKYILLSTVFASLLVVSVAEAKMITNCYKSGATGRTTMYTCPMPHQTRQLVKLWGVGSCTKTGLNLVCRTGTHIDVYICLNPAGWTGGRGFYYCNLP